MVLGNFSGRWLNAATALSCSLAIFLLFRGSQLGPQIRQNFLSASSSKQWAQNGSASRAAGAERKASVEAAAAAEGERIWREAQEEDLRQQKLWFASQALLRSSQIRARPERTNLLYLTTPEVVCPTMVRVGRPGDGGKWTCNPWRLPDNCTIVSLGVGGDPSFEKELQQRTQARCEVHAVDSDANFAHLFDGVPRATFHHALLVAGPASADPPTPPPATQLPPILISTAQADKTSNGRNKAIQRRKRDAPTATYASLQSSFAKRFVEVLKMDIENGEYSVLPPLLKADAPLFCQLLVEVHEMGQADVPQHRLPDLLMQIGAAKYLQFAAEPNLLCSERKGFCSEYGFIHQSCLERYGVERRVLGSRAHKRR